MDVPKFFNDVLDFLKVLFGVWKIYIFMVNKIFICFMNFITYKLKKIIFFILFLNFKITKQIVYII